MRITVRLFSHLVRWAPAGSTRGESPLDLGTGATVAAAIEALAIPAQVRRVVTVNDQNSRDDRILGDGDVLKVFPVAMGG